MNLITAGWDKKLDWRRNRLMACELTYTSTLEIDGTIDLKYTSNSNLWL